ncbi:MAG TPA: hypothetical protein VGF67_04245, partial [Ktedonobacteraceae bacterium]
MAIVNGGAKRNKRDTSDARSSLRKQPCAHLLPILEQGMIQPKTETKRAGKNRKVITQALAAWHACFLYLKTRPLVHAFFTRILATTGLSIETAKPGGNSPHHPRGKVPAGSNVAHVSHKKWSNIR